ncbi:MAG: hypothetical protein Sapg2KO_17610 [Saprospiraceae bacterium]
MHPTNAQTPTQAFYKAHKKKPGVFNIKIPSFLIWFGGGIAYNSVKDPEAKAALRIAKKVKGLKVMTVESDNVIAKADINYFLQNMRNGSFEDLIFVKEEDTRVQILGRASSKKLKELTILVEESGSFTFVTAKTNLKSKDVSRLINSIVNSDQVQEDTRAEKRADRQAKRKKRKETKAVKKLPQA